MGEVVEIFKEIGAVYEGRHFVLKDGRHSDSYYYPDPLLVHSKQALHVAGLLALKIVEVINPAGCVVLGPDYGGNYLASLVASQLCDLTDEEIYWVGTKKKDVGHLDNFPFMLEPDRGFRAVLNGRRAIIVEDILSSGHSAGGVSLLALHHHARIAAAVAAIVRTDVTADQVYANILIAGERVSADVDSADNCRWCRAEQPIVIDAGLGYGSQYMRDHPHYAGRYIKLLG